MIGLEINIESISPLSNKLSPIKNNINIFIPKPPCIKVFSKDIQPIFLFIKKFSDGSYDIKNLNNLIRLNSDNFREKFLYTLVNFNIYNEIIKEYPYYSEWLEYADYIKKNLKNNINFK